MISYGIMWILTIYFLKRRDLYEHFNGCSDSCESQRLHFGVQGKWHHGKLFHSARFEENVGLGYFFLCPFDAIPDIESSLHAATEMQEPANPATLLSRFLPSQFFSPESKIKKRRTPEGWENKRQKKNISTLL